MTAVGVEAVQASNPTARYLRQSSMLVIAKTLSQAVEFGLQLFAIRYFSKADFGAFGYALSVVLIFRAIALFEMPLALARFIPSHRERRRGGAVLGSVVIGVVVVSGLGLLLAIGLATAVELLHIHPTGDAQAVRLLVVLAFFVPLDALDVLLTTLFAVFGRPRIIVVRQVILGPAVRIGLVVAVVVAQASILGFAIGYLIASAVSLAIYGGIFLRVVLRERSTFEVSTRKLTYPARQTFAFAAPMLVSTLVWVLLDSSDGILLGHFKDIEQVAAFRAVVPLAFLNQGIILAATALYSPALAALVARQEEDEVARLYWRSTLWIAIATAPVFIASFCFAPELATFVLGRRYESSAWILAILSAGYYFHSALGYNGLTLRVLGKVRYSVSIDVAAAVANVLVNIVLIPRWGAIGAAVGTSSTLCLHNVLKQVGLRHYTRISFFERAYVAPYALLLGLVAALFVVAKVASPSIWVGLALTCLATCALVWKSGRLLGVDDVFPELQRFLNLRPLGGRS